MSAAAAGQYAARLREPLRICPSPAVEQRVRRLLAVELPPDASVLGFERERPPALSSPAILLLAEGDLKGALRARLLALAQAARPGRPILLGGTRNRDTLIEAINTWRVFRILPEEAADAVLGDALRKAHEALQLERGLERAAEELRADNVNLEEVLRNLEQAQQRLCHTERLVTLGGTTATLIPVIGNHLAALEEFNALVAANPRCDPCVTELLGFAFTGIRSLRAMLDEIRAYAESRPEIYRFALVDVDAMVRFAVSFSRFDSLAVDRNLHSDLRSQAKTLGDSFRLHQVVLNLLRNALQATPAAGDIRVATSVDGNNVLIDVENAGDPIPPEVQARLFEPFFSTKGDEGMGLGLSLCRAAVERHGGTITCASGPGRATRFRIALPRSG